MATYVTRLKPGEIVGISGIYRTNDGSEATMVRGEPAPPTPYHGWAWVLVRAAIHH